MSPVKDLEPSLRPREKALGKGLTSLSEAELLALILSTGGVRGKSAIDLANALLAKFHSLYGISRASTPDLLSVEGMGKAKALSLLSAFEIASRAQKSAAKPPSFSAELVYRLAMEGFSRGGLEEAMAFHFDRRGLLIGSGVRLVSSGGGQVPLHVGEILRLVLRSGAGGFALAHYHPSGELRPSKEDVAATAILSSRSASLGINFLDHLICAEGGYFSFRENGLF